MAGTILIGHESAIALNSIGYDRIIEAIRDEFPTSETALLKAIYEPSDVAHLNFISLREQDKAGFRVFYSAALAAFNKTAGEGQTFPEWVELIDKLRADSRCEP
jgi:hypothetical protein